MIHVLVNLVLSVTVASWHVTFTFVEFQFRSCSRSAIFLFLKIDHEA